MLDVTSIVDRHRCHMAVKFGLFVEEDHSKLPTLYWLPKLHKRPYKSRFIANSSVCITTELSILLTSCSLRLKTMSGAQWLSGRVLDSRPKGRGFEPHRRHCVVSLSRNINPCLVLVQPRKIRPFITERLLMGRKESNQTNQTKTMSLNIVQQFIKEMVKIYFGLIKIQLKFLIN